MAKRGDLTIPSFIRFTQSEFLNCCKPLPFFVHYITFILTYATQRYY